MFLRAFCGRPVALSMLNTQRRPYLMESFGHHVVDQVGLPLGKHARGNRMEPDRGITTMTGQTCEGRTSDSLRRWSEQLLLLSLILLYAVWL